MLFVFLFFSPERTFHFVISYPYLATPYYAKLKTKGYLIYLLEQKSQNPPIPIQKRPSPMLSITTVNNAPRPKS
jgi:hypothetical protein